MRIAITVPMMVATDAAKPNASFQFMLNLLFSIQSEDCTEVGDKPPVQAFPEFIIFDG